MALKKTLARADNRIKALFTDAYFRVMSVELTEAGVSKIKVSVFADQEARTLALEPNQSNPMPYMMTGPGASGASVLEKTYETTLPAAPSGTYASLQEQTKAAAYVFLKAHADFVGSTDC